MGLRGPGAAGPLRLLATLLDLINEGVGRLVAWLALGMVLTTFAVVVLRYLAGWGDIALQESVLYMHAGLFLLGGAYTLKRDGHVRVDILYRHFPPRVRATIDLLGTLLLLVPVALFIFAMSWEYVTISWSLHEGSREAGGLPYVYLLKSTILALAALLLVQGGAEALRALAALLDGDYPLKGHGDG